MANVCMLLMSIVDVMFSSIHFKLIHINLSAFSIHTEWNWCDRDRRLSWPFHESINWDKRVWSYSQCNVVTKESDDVWCVCASAVDYTTNHDFNEHRHSMRTHLLWIYLRLVSLFWLAAPRILLSPTLPHSIRLPQYSSLILNHISIPIELRSQENFELN